MGATGPVGPQGPQGPIGPGAQFIQPTQPTPAQTQGLTTWLWVNTADDPPTLWCQDGAL